MKKLFSIDEAVGGAALILADGSTAHYVSTIPPMNGSAFRHVIRRHTPAVRDFFVNDQGAPREGDPIYAQQVYLNTLDEPDPVKVEDLPFLCMVRTSETKIPVQVTAFSRKDQILLIPKMSTLGHVTYCWVSIQECREAKLQWCDARESQRSARWRSFDAPERSPYPSNSGAFLEELKATEMNKLKNA